MVGDETEEVGVGRCRIDHELCHVGHAPIVNPCDGAGGGGLVLTARFRPLDWHLFSLQSGNGVFGHGSEGRETRLECQAQTGAGGEGDRREANGGEVIVDGLTYYMSSPFKPRRMEDIYNGSHVYEGTLDLIRWE